MITALCLMLSAMMAVTPAPREMLSAEMILIEIAQDGARNKSGSYTAHGQCKRFQYDSFADASQGYMLADYPGVALFMPHDHASVEESGRPVGTCWEMPDVSEGNAFVEVASYDFDNSISRKENQELARAFLQNIQAGDVMQMLATYSSGGRGTHTIMFTRPYDSRLSTLYWVDSNFANTRIDGVKYGFVRAYQSWAFEDVVTWLTKDGNNGATLYRVNDNVVKAELGSSILGMKTQTEAPEN